MKVWTVWYNNREWDSDIISTYSNLALAGRELVKYLEDFYSDWGRLFTFENIRYDTGIVTIKIREVDLINGTVTPDESIYYYISRNDLDWI